jgi:hypothetical protein
LPNPEIDRFPERIPSGSPTGRRVWKKAPGCYALLDAGQQNVKILAGAPPPDASGASLRPAYALEDGPGRAVPTGRVYLRFRTGVQAESRRSEMEAAGFTLDRLVPYAPHTVWLKASSDNPAEALARIGMLADLPDVEWVEPQMISPRALR